MTSSFTTSENGNIDIKLVLPWADVKAAFETEVDKAVANAEITGFRKGKAPKDLVLPKLNKDELYSHAIQKLVPEAYSQSIKEHNLKPVLHPKLTLTKGEEGNDWEFLATTCELPTATLPQDYTTGIKKLKPEKPEAKLETILDYLSKTVTVKIPDILVEEEANHRLSGLVENISRIGLTTENYLASKKLTPETLKSQTAAQSRTDLAMEFILNAVMAKEQLKDRKSTLDFLSSLV